MGQRGNDRERHLVATLNDEGAVVDMRLHLVDDHFFNGISTLEGVAHAHRALGSAVAKYGNAEMEWHSAVLPNPQGGPGSGFRIDDMRRMVRTAATDCNPRSVRFDAIVNRLKRPV